MSRLKAASLHLLLSILVIGSVATLGFLLWYPHGLYRVAEFDRILWIMFGIDLVAGPLLTFVVYRQGKRSLPFDLSVIAVFQLAFFLYGLNTLWQVRPVFLVASEVRANLVFANEIAPAELAKATNPEWRDLSWSGPRLVGVLPPRDHDEQQDQLFAFLETGIDVHQLPRYYVEYEQVKKQLVGGAEPAREGLVSVPVVSRYGVASLLIDPQTAEPVGTEAMK